MVPPRTLLLVIAGLWLAVLSTAQIPLLQFIEGDPPSLHNGGDGGLTELVSVLTVYRKVKIAESARDVIDHDPSSTVLLVAGLERPPTDLEVSMLTEWVKMGGHLIVLDEYTTPLHLLERFGLSLGELFSGIDVGSCDLGDRKLEVVFNVYREVRGGETVCWVGGIPVAATRSFGAGRVTVVGDSSLFINEVMRSRYRQAQMSLALRLLDRDTVLFYEGGRRFRGTAFSPRFLVLVPYYVLRFAAYVVYTGSPYDVLKVVAGAALVLVILLPRSHLRQRPIRRVRRGVDASDISRTFDSLVTEWVKRVRAIGGEG